MQITQVRQGDVLLIRRPAPAPGTARLVEGAAGLRVPGERTGHAHTLLAEVYDHQDGRLLYLSAPGALLHEEHAPVLVPPGWWEPRLQREFVPAARPVPRARFD